MKHPAQSQGHGQPYTWPAPFRGWVEDEFPARPGGAAVLENLLPTRSGCRVRGGCQMMSTVPGPVTGMFSYDDGGVVQRLFVGTATGIHNVSALDGTPAVLALAASGGEWSTTMFRTVGDQYLYAVNGNGNPYLFNGTVWQEVTTGSTPISITGGAAPYSSVFVFKSRLYFVRANSMTVYYLPVGQAGGAAADLNLAGVFNRGGSIAFGASWSSDSGSGFGDRLVLASDMGEVVVFEGSDPSDPADWRKVGQYAIPRPLGKNAWVRSGGDLLIATTEGLLAMSSIVSRDSAGLAASSLSAPIARSWAVAAEISGQGWVLARWETARVLLVLRPHDHGRAWGVSMETGAWFTITGWDMHAAAMHNGRFYFGGQEGVVRRGDTTGQDDGMPIIARYRGLLEAAPRGGFKVVQLARATVTATTDDPVYALSFYAASSDPWAPTEGAWAPVSDEGRWDFGLWDQMRWSSASADTLTVASEWRAIGVSGPMLAPEVQIVSDDLLPVVAEIRSVDAIIGAGGVVV